MSDKQKKHSSESKNPQEAANKTAFHNSAMSAQTNSNMVILGVDPGLAKAGWGIIAPRSMNLQRLVQIESSSLPLPTAVAESLKHSAFEAVDYGVLKTNSDQSHAQRLLSIFEQLQEVIGVYKPRLMAVEEVFQGKNPRSAFLAGEGRGACILAGATAKLRVVEFAATAIKLSVCGNGQAAKQQVQSMVQRILELDEIPHPHDAADALAVALTYLQRSGSFISTMPKPTSSKVKHAAGSSARLRSRKSSSGSHPDGESKRVSWPRGQGPRP